MMSEMDIRYMRMCLELARKGEGLVEPNPYVGCVIVKNGCVIGKGYHRKFGGFHAEIEALKSCSVSPSGATMYINLEPCCHTGKTPPCTDAIIASGIKKVVIGCLDPNALVSGKGMKLLRTAGIEVITSELEHECQKLNEAFFHWIQTGLPYVTTKLAISSDGFIAGKNGKPVHLTSRASDLLVHKLRNKNQSIMVGSHTIVNDNPLLTSRIAGYKSRDPLRIIIDSELKSPVTSKIFLDENYLLALSQDTKKSSIKKFRNIWISPNHGKVHLKKLLKHLGKNNISSILLEGGAHLMDVMMEKHLVQKCHYIFTPKYLGEGMPWSCSQKRCILKDIETKNVGPDIWITGAPKKSL